MDDETTEYRVRTWNKVMGWWSFSTPTTNEQMARRKFTAETERWKLDQTVSAPELEQRVVRPWKTVQA